MADVDWVCDSCTFINSGLLHNCEICEAPRVAADGEPAGPCPGPGANDPIVLSDGEDGAAAKASGSKDVIDLADGAQGARRNRGAGTGPNSVAAAPARGAARNQSTQSKHQPDADVTIIDDEDDDAGGSSAAVNAAGHRGQPGSAPTAANKRPGSADEVYTLDTCNCSVPLELLATQLRPAVTATIQASAPAGTSAAGTSRAGASAAHKAAGTTTSTTLFDVAAPLLCPAPGCGCWLSSRDVRLLLGPQGTQALFYTLCAALRREGKAAKAAKHGDAAKTGDADPNGIPALPPPPTAKGRRGGGGRKQAGAAAAADAGAGAGSGAAAAPQDAPTPLLPLAPSCPGCRARMVPVSHLPQILQRHQQPQQQQQPGAPQPQGQPPPSPQRPQRRQATRSSARQAQQQHQQPTEEQGASGGSGSAAAAAAAATSEQLRGALAARGLPSPAPDCSLERICGQLRDAVGTRCAFLCLGCDRNLDDGAVLPKQRLQELQCMADQAHRVLKLLRRVRAVLLSAQEEDDEEEGQEEGEGEGGGGKGATGAGPSGSGRGARAAPAATAGGDSRGKKRRRSSKWDGGYGGDGNKAWAKGVGYGGGGGGGWHYGGGGGGGGGPSASDAAARKAAQERQREADKEVRSCLKDLLDALSPSIAGGGGGGGPGLGLSPPPVLHAALQYGGLPYVLRLLLQNDSLLDMGARAELYRAAMEVVRALMSSMSLLELLGVPATDPRDTDSNAAPQGAAPGGPSSDPPLSAVFDSLGRQCAIFKRSAQELADGAEEDIEALGLALEVGSLAEEVTAGVAMWRDSMGEAKGTLHALLPLQAPDGNAAAGSGAADGANTGAAAAATPSGAGHARSDMDVPLAKRTRRGGGAAAAADGVAPATVGGGSAGAAAGGAAAGDAAADAATASSLVSRRSEYISVMKALQFREVRLLDDHYFRREVDGSSGSSASAGGELMRTRLKRITGEISGLASGLPLDWEAAAFVAVDDARVDVLRALLLPASDTPYAHGPFIFDILLPPDYPTRPPKVQFLTTGGGKVRFNPNLYAEGKVCLSLLGTWSGPSWDPTMSTILQVLVSIQSMILVSDPYYNEPGWEAQAGTPAGRQAASDYALTQRYNTLAFSILPALQMLKGKANALSGGSTFRDVLSHHFRLKRPEILRQCDEWMAALEASARQVPTAPTYAYSTGAAVVQAAGVGGPGGQQPQQQQQQQESNQEKLRKYAGQVVPQIKSFLQSL